jgi:hypothetical protein
MSSQFSESAAGMLRLVLTSLALTALIGAVNEPALGAPGDFNGDGIVSQADLSLIGDGFGSQFFCRITTPTLQTMGKRRHFLPLYR